LTAEQQADLDPAYGYHAPTPEQVKLYEAINEAAKNFEAVVLRACPSSADRSAAQRQIRDARMTANRSIALAGFDEWEKNHPEYHVFSAAELASRDRVCMGNSPAAPARPAPAGGGAEYRPWDGPEFGVKGAAQQG